MKNPIVQSHRGAGALAPENTLESFVASWELGTIPEADLRTTKDGVIVSFHDANFSRVVKDASPELREKGVQDVSFEELLALDVGMAQGQHFAEQQVCRIESIFGLMSGLPERGLYLDIKNVDLPQLAAIATEFGVSGQVILASPQETMARHWMELVPDGQTLLWMGITRRGDEDTLRERLAALRAQQFAGITQVQIHIEVVSKEEQWVFKPTLGFMREVADQLEQFEVLFQSLPWDCSDPEVYRALLEAGVQSFASDYPEVALRVMLGYDNAPS